MKVIVIREKGDEIGQFAELITLIRKFHIKVKIYLGARSEYDFEVALQHRLSGWVDIPEDKKVD